jgi:hypothetical protein
MTQNRAFASLISQVRMVHTVELLYTLRSILRPDAKTNPKTLNTKIGLQPARAPFRDARVTFFGWRPQHERPPTRPVHCFCSADLAEVVNQWLANHS